MKTIKAVKNQKGITLVEVLAVLVILGILATVAIPAIGAIIENSKKDAMIATAEQMAASFRMMEAANDSAAQYTGNTVTVTGDQMIKAGYMEGTKLKSPNNKKEGFKTATLVVTITPADATNKVEASKSYKITLDDGVMSITDKEVSALERKDVTVK